MTDRFELMRHALGVHAYHHKGGLRWKMPYRNHFVAGGDDVLAWNTLVADSYARCVSNGNPLSGGAPVYVVTDAGRTAALDGLIFKRRWGYGTPTNGLKLNLM